MKRLVSGGFSPLSDAADAAILLGAAGLVTGYGGKYLGLIPVLTDGVNGLPWGTPAGKFFGEQPPWDGFASQNPALGLGYKLKSYLMVITNGTFGQWDMQSYPNPQTWPNEATYVNDTLYCSSMGQGGQVGWNPVPTPGALGPQGGYLFIALLGAGVVVRVMAR